VHSLDVETPRGPAEVLITDPAGRPVSQLVLGHGAGGGVHAPDLTRVHDVAVAAGVRVVLVTQPYRVAGRRSPAPAAQLDEAWTAIVRAVATSAPLILGGRSSGARVACRTAAALPVAVPTLVVNGDRDPFGVPEPAGPVEVAVRPGATHDLRKDLAGTGDIVLTWLRAHGWAR
jgi:predicted alpha/beta-hydrolase family hydrolase